MRIRIRNIISVMAILAFVTSVAVFAVDKTKAAPEFHEGFEYFGLATAQKTRAEKGKIEVVELFWYGCGHCYRFEPTLDKWLKSKPKNITFFRIPAQFPNFPGYVFHAKAYYTAVILKVVDKVHRPLFDAMHLNNNRLDTKEKVKAVFVKNGVKAEDFDKVFDSDQVTLMMARDKKIAQGYNASGVPLMVVNGKYKAGASELEGSFAQLVVLVEYLVKKELATK